MTTPIAAWPLDRRVVPHVVGPWYALPPPGFDQWEVMLGSMRLTINANSHQAAKRVAVSHWAACSADADNFRRALAARIAEKWRGGIKARRVVRHNVQLEGAAGGLPPEAPLERRVRPRAPTKKGAEMGHRKVCKHCGGAEEAHHDYEPSMPDGCVCPPGEWGRTVTDVCREYIGSGSDCERCQHDEECHKGSNVEFSGQAASSRSSAGTQGSAARIQGDEE